MERKRCFFSMRPFQSNFSCFEFLFQLFLLCLTDEIDRVLDSEGCNNRNSSRPKEVLQLLDVVGDLLKENNVSDATALLFICTQLIVSKLGQTDNYLPQSSKSFVSVRQSANADVHATPFRCVINWVT